MKSYMVVERFKTGCFDAVYERYRKEGRMLPEGLHYIDSWVSKENNVCYQLMQTKKPELFEQWISHWADLVVFDIVPID